jgi:uncharacterized protein YjiS (DUF1127 family)
MHIPAYIHLPAETPATRPAGCAAAPAPLLRVLRTMRAWWDRQRTLAALEELDEATLRDIGVTRADLRARFDADRHGARGIWSRP